MMPANTDPIAPMPQRLLADEGYDDLAPRTLNFAIEDSFSPNEFIIKEIQKANGNNPISGAGRVQIKTDFDKAGGKGNVKIYLFNNKSVIQYYFIKKTTVTLNLADGPVILNFTKNIYTNIEPPRSFNSTLHEDRSTIALMSASLFSEVESDELRHQMGLPTAMKHQVDEKIRKDVVKKGFLAVALFAGKDMIVGNKTPGIIDRLRGKHPDTNLKGRMITHARFASLEENKIKGKDEERAGPPKVKYHLIDLELVKSINRSNLKHSVENSRFDLQMNENAPSYLRDIANIHNAALLNTEFDNLISMPEVKPETEFDDNPKGEIRDFDDVTRDLERRDNRRTWLSPEEKNERVLELLNSNKINKNIYWALMNSENEKLHSELNRQYALLSRLDYLDELVREFDSQKVGALSPELKQAIYPSKKGKIEKLKKHFVKEKFKPFELFENLRDLGNKKAFEGEDQEMLELILSYCERIEQKMRDLNQEMKKNENYLQLIANINNAHVKKRSANWDKVLQEEIYHSDEEDFFVQ